MDRLPILWVNFIKGKEPAWTWQDLAQIQSCVNTVLLLPESQQWCSPVHAAPTWDLPAWLAPLGGRGCCQWAGTFLLRCLWASPASWNEHPGNRRAETLSGQKRTNYPGLSLSRVFSPSLSCVMESWRVSKQNTEEGTGCLFLSQHFRVLPPVLFPDRSNFQPPRSWQHRVQEQEVNHVVWLHVGAGICHRERSVHKRADHAVKKSLVWRQQGIEHNCLGDAQMLHGCMCSCLPPSSQRPPREFSVNQ